MPYLESLCLKNIWLNGRIHEFQLFAKSILDKRLKSFSLIDASITDINSFQFICDALSNSAMEVFRLESFGIFYQPDLTPLINVLPKVTSLKRLDLQGQKMLDVSQLSDVLEYTKIRYLGLNNIELTDEYAYNLAQKIPLTKLVRIDLRSASIIPKGKQALLAAMNATRRLHVYF